MNGYKIITTQVVSLLAAILVMFGVDLTPDQQASIVTAILTVANVATIILRKYFTEPKQ